METITLYDKKFRIFIKSTVIDEEISKLAQRLNQDLYNQNPLFLCILNGSFMFASDLLKQIDIPGTEVSFMKISSYEGISTSGEIKEIFGLTQDIRDRTVVILEDIIDTGKSMEYLIGYLQKRNPEKIITVTLFHKPDALKYNIPIDYSAIALSNDFVVGRGLDYNELGRNLPDLYIIHE